jgi:dienelactone hydrolase
MSRVAGHGRRARRVSLVAGVVLVGAVAVTATVAAATTSATTTASRHGAARQLTLAMPALTGPYRVGTRSLELVDRSRREPGSDGREPRSLVIQLWYPRTSGKGKAARYMPPKVAAYTAASSGLPASAFSRLKLTAISNAVPLPRAGGWPVVLFSTGYGLERQLYTGLVSDLASHGYMVVAIDHPHDANIVAFPDGHTVSIGNVGQAPDAIAKALTVRIADTRYALDTLARLNRHRKANPLGGMFDLDRVGMFGHSLGGAAAAGTMLTDRRIRGGLDMDGRLFGKVATTGLKRPFMLFAADPGFRSNPSLAEFWNHLTGSRYAVDFTGAAHLAFSDLRVPRSAARGHEQCGASAAPAAGRRDQPDGRLRSRARPRPRLLRPRPQREDRDRRRF